MSFCTPSSLFFPFIGSQTARAPAGNGRFKEWRTQIKISKFLLMHIRMNMLTFFKLSRTDGAPSASMPSHASVCWSSIAVACKLLRPVVSAWPSVKVWIFSDLFLEVPFLIIINFYLILTELI